MVVLLATFGWLVFGRYVLNVTPTWVEQLALVLVGYITFLALQPAFMRTATWVSRCSATCWAPAPARW